ncbi:MAG TPA: MarR family transcriptional regulator [Ramlibacter sp.]|nr:MarR family transcriptional regulator [Ramlibacter sp.]
MSLADPRTVDDLLNYRLSCLLDSSGAMVIRLCEGRYGITRREWRLIALLAAHGAMSPSELAERAHLERARTSRHITGLAERQLIRRVQLAHDGRRARVELTEQGRQLHEELFPQSVVFHRQVLQALSAAELAAFDTALAKLTEAAQRIARARPVAEKADRRHGGARRLRER